MNTPTICISLLLIFTISYAQSPDTLWTALSGGIHHDYGESIVQTPDGGFVAAGNTQYTGTNNYDIHLVKTNAAGQILWTQTLGGDSSDFASCIKNTSDGGLIVAGYTGSYGAGSYDIYLIKTDAAGDTIWTRTCGAEGCDWGYWVEQTSDGGYIICGHTTSYGGCDLDVMLTKTDSLGNELWFQFYPGISDNWDKGFCVKQTADGGYIITGESAMNYYSYDVLLIKTDAYGNALWTRTIGGDADDGGHEVCLTPDGGYIVAGYTWSYGNGMWDVYLVKTDFLGGVEWQKTFGGDSYECGKNLQITNDGGYIIAGYNRSFFDPYCDGYIIKTDPSGNEEWCKILGGHGWDEFTGIRQTAEGGYIAAGTTVSFGAQEHDVWICRLDSDPVPLIFSLTPQIYPIQIPAGGGIFTFDLLIENGNGFPVDFDVWTEAVLPNGIVRGPIILSVERTIPGGTTISRELTQFVPGNAPGGNYTYNGYAGEYPYIVFASDSFVFEKLGESAEDLADGGWECFGWDKADEFPEAVPDEFGLLSVHPNPFNTATTLSFNLSSAGQVSLQVYDITGRSVGAFRETPLQKWYPAGYHEVVWNAEGCGSGVYFVRLDLLSTAESRQRTSVRKVVLVK